MPDPTVYEQLEILRRIAERGKMLSEGNIYIPEGTDVQSMFVDLFVHLLDEIERTETTYFEMDV